MRIKPPSGLTGRYPPSGQIVGDDGIEVADTDLSAAWLIEHDGWTVVEPKPQAKALKGDAQ